MLISLEKVGCREQPGSNKGIVIRGVEAALIKGQRARLMAFAPLPPPAAGNHLMALLLRTHFLNSAALVQRLAFY